MPAKPREPAPLDQSVIQTLACPACRGSLLFEGASLICAGCGRSYPVIDGIPVLIAERAAHTRE